MQAPIRQTSTGKNFDHVLLNALFQLIECGQALDELKNTSFYKHERKQRINKVIEDIEDHVKIYQPVWTIDDSAVLQFSKAQKEWSEVMIDIQPEKRVQILEMAKLAKEKPAHFNSIAVAMGCGIITVKGDK